MKSLVLLLVLLVSFTSYSESIDPVLFESMEMKATKGDIKSQMNLGYLYFEGKGVSKDEKKAVYWITKSANQGDVTAQTTLSNYYIDKDYVQSYKWGLLASQQAMSLKKHKGITVRTTKDFNTALISGFIEMNLESLKKKMTPKQMLKAKTLTSQFKKSTRVTE